MRRTATSSVASITRALLGSLTDDERADLASEDVQLAIEVHFGPIGLKSLPARNLAEGPCSTDGYYEAEVDPARPWILFVEDVAPQRTHFTLLHELGHHLLRTRSVELLDDLDALAGSADRNIELEEAICHRFAGHVLISDELLAGATDGAELRPEHLKQLHEQSNASWEAVAVRAAASTTQRAAVVLMRSDSTVAFCAPSLALDGWWPRGSPVDPNGPLSRSLRFAQTAKPETFRFGLAYEERFFCDSIPIHAGLAVAVLTGRPSDGHFELLEETEPAWRTRVRYCHCGGELVEGWCTTCNSPHCRDCGSCQCATPADNPACPACHLRKAFRAGAKVCRDCEEDGYTA